MQMPGLQMPGLQMPGMPGLQSGQWVDCGLPVIRTMVSCIAPVPPVSPVLKG